MFDCPQVDLLTTRANVKLPLCAFPVLVPVAWKLRCFSEFLEWPRCLCISLLRSSKTGLVESDAYDKSLLVPGTSSLALEGVVLLALLMEELLEVPLLLNLLVQPHVWKSHRGLEMLQLHAQKL